MAGTGPEIVLAWPDPGQSDDAVRALLADVTAELVIAGWNPDDEDHGRTDLLTSLRDARERIASGGGDPDDLTLVGFGRGGLAAAGLARYAKRLGIGLGRVIAVDATWDEPDPFSGVPLEKVPKQVELVDHADDMSATLD